MSSESPDETGLTLIRLLDYTFEKNLLPGTEATLFLILQHILEKYNDPGFPTKVFVDKLTSIQVVYKHPALLKSLAILNKTLSDDIEVGMTMNISEEEKLALEKKAMYLESQLEYINGYPREEVEKKERKFSVNEIIGARDKEGKWWLSRILSKFNDPVSGIQWYYVHFHGWSHDHNEWIGDSHKIKKFNPRKHILKR